MNPTPVPEFIPTVEISLDQPRRLVQDFGALMAFEGLSGVNTRNAQAMANLNATQMAQWVWALLLHDTNGEVPLEQVQAWMMRADYALAIEQGIVALEVKSFEMMAAAVKGATGETGTGQDPS